MDQQIGYDDEGGADQDQDQSRLGDDHRAEEQRPVGERLKELKAALPTGLGRTPRDTGFGPGPAAAPDSTTADLLKKAAGVEKGSPTPNKTKIGSVSRKQIEEIAQLKMPDLNAFNLDSAIRTIEGTARNMGLEVRD